MLLFALAMSIAAPTLGGCRVLPDNHVFNTAIDTLPVHPSSAAMIDTLGTTGVRLHLDLGQTTDQQSPEYWGIPYNLVNADMLTWKDVRFHSDDSGAYFDGAPESDCGDGDAQNALRTPCEGVAKPRLPIPDAPLVEGGVATDQSDYGDHHILVLDTAHCHLWEAYHAYKTLSGWDILSSAFFDLRSNALRAETWTSADAAGFPMLPLLLRAEEAASGTIAHALRFTIPSSKIRNSYVWPARHRTSNGDLSEAKPPMGQLFRLKASYEIPSGFSTQSRAILQALKTYGMYLADGGSTAYIQGEPSAAWDDSIFDEVQSVVHTSFEAVDLAAVTQRPGFDPDSAAVPGAMAGDVGTPGAPGASGPGMNPEGMSQARGCQAAPVESGVSCLWPLLLARGRRRAS